MADSPRRRRPIIPIRLIVTTAVVMLLAGAVIAGGMVQEQNARRALNVELETRLLQEARHLALASSSAFLTDFPELTLHPLTREIQVKQSEVGLVVVEDSEGKILGHPDFEMLGRPAALPPGLEARAPLVALGAGERLLSSPDLLVATAPVRHPTGRIMGTASVGIQRSYLEGIIAEARQQQLMLMVVVLFAGLLLALVLMNALLRPIGVLRRGLERIGQGDLDTPVELKDRTEFGMLAETMNAMATELKSAQQEMVEKERMTTELTLARDLQSSLIPTTRTEAGEFVIHGAHQSALEVGGDYYDVFLLPENKVGVTIADVSGKGLSGCLVMSMLSALLRAFRDDYESPSELLVKLDERLTENLQRGSFVTMFYGILDPATGTMTFASAAHSPTLVYRRATGKVDRVETTGIPLGAVRGGAIRKTLKDETLVLQEGDMLVQYTDGINESFDAGGEEQFGFDRMKSVLGDAATRGCDSFIEDLQTALGKWQEGGSRLDDETLLVVSRELTEVSALPATAVPEVARIDENGVLQDEVPDDEVAEDEVAEDEQPEWDESIVLTPLDEGPGNPVLGDPVAEDPVAEDPAPSGDEPSGDEPSGDEPISEEPAAEEAAEGDLVKASSTNGPEPSQEKALDDTWDEPVTVESAPEPEDDRSAVTSVTRDPGLALVRPEASHSDSETGAWLTEARGLGDCLRLPADLNQLGGLRGWLVMRSHMLLLDDARLDLIHTALYEACANIAEHGYGENPNQSFEVYWVGESRIFPGRSYFLIRDQGVPFSADNWSESDFGHPQTWKRGRGFGLDIIHRVMSGVSYRPETEVGNFTLLTLDLEDEDGAKEEARRAG